MLYRNFPDIGILHLAELIILRCHVCTPRASAAPTLPGLRLQISSGALASFNDKHGVG